MLIICGSMLCPDCIQCRKELDEAGIAYEYRDFSEKMAHLKEFLALRDREPIFEEVRNNGKVGIPCIITPEGVTLSWEQLLPQKEDRGKSEVSPDGANRGLQQWTVDS